MTHRRLSAHASWNASLALYGAALAVFVAHVVRDVTAPEARILSMVPDDAFYYLQIGRHFAHGLMSTADGVSRTNGYHPLWMLLCAGLARFTDGWTLVRVAMAASLACHVAASLVARRILARTRARDFAWVGAACWLISPLLYPIAVQAVEAGVYSLALLIALDVHLRIAAATGHDAQAARRLAPWFGATLGLVFLARTEGAIVAVLGLAWLAWRAAAMREGSGGWRMLARAIVGTACLVLPWCLFSFALVGTVVQDSGAMKVLWTSDAYPTLASRYRNVILVGELFLRQGPRMLTTWSIPSLALAGGYAALSVALANFALPRRPGPEQTMTRALVVPTACVAATYAMFLSDGQLWWLTLPAASLTMFVSLAVGASLAGATARARLWAGVTVVAAACGASLVAAPPAFYPWQADVYASQAVIRDMIPPQARIGSFNAGIPMFFGRGTEIALDGLVSHDARAFWQLRRFGDYLRQQRIEYIVDETRAMNRARRFSAGPLDLHEIASFPLTMWGGDRILWRVQGTSTPD